jgi:hypothetical protein
LFIPPFISNSASPFTSLYHQIYILYPKYKFLEKIDER